jgi:predicted ester cyclase
MGRGTNRQALPLIARSGRGLQVVDAAGSPARDTGRPVGASASREERVAALIRIGELELTGENEAEVDAYFAPGFVFHGPDGAQLDYEGLRGYFASLRAAFDELAISRGIIVAEGDYVACQTTISGSFVREFTQSPVGSLQPNGNRVVFELMNIFRYDDRGRLAEEWVQADNRSRLRDLGAPGR